MHFRTFLCKYTIFKFGFLNIILERGFFDPHDPTESAVGILTQSRDLSICGIVVMLSLGSLAFRP